MRRYSMSIDRTAYGDEVEETVEAVEDDEGEWLKAADVQAWLEAWHKKAIQENDCDAEPIIAELLVDLAQDREK